MIAMPTRRNPAPLALLLIAFACIYVIWGSTYLAIRFAIESIPPLTMVGIRYIIAGAILYGWVVWRGGARLPTTAEWRAAFIYGGFFFVAGNGGVSWSETRIPSGIVALLVAAVPLWMTLFEAVGRGGRRPTALAIVGLLLGFGGIALLIGPGITMTRPAIDPAGALVMVLSPMGWAYGSVNARRAPHPPSLLHTSAMQMLAGGVLSLLLGGLIGEWPRFHADAISMRSALSILYLIAFGSIIAFSAYTWLLQVVPATRVGTYSFVNPIVAVFLGWAFGGEIVTQRTLIAGAVAVSGVVMIMRARASRVAAAAPVHDSAAKERA